MQQLLIRTDANTQIGLGHFMRCFALAQAWKDRGGRVTFLTAATDKKLTELLQKEDMAIINIGTQIGSLDDARDTSKLAKEVGAVCIVVDGYQFNGQYQNYLKAKGSNLLWLDDFRNDQHYSADLVLNQNLYAHARDYSNCKPNTKLLLGAPYVLLRRQFEKWRSRQVVIADIARKILVTMGGGDPQNVTVKILDTLEYLVDFGLEIKIIVGAANPHKKDIQMKMEKSALNIHMLEAVTDMPQLMDWADLAISAGGSTNLEFGFMGLPNCMVILAENQELNAETFQTLGMSENLGWFDEFDVYEASQSIRALMVDKKRRESMSTTGRSIIQGYGSKNVISAIRSSFKRND